MVYMVITGEREREKEKFRINISTLFLFSEKSSWMDKTPYTKLRGCKSECPTIYIYNM